jgi:uncharacterized LabA/DUF88 family protein
MNRTSFVIDGFNLYHSVFTAQKDLGGKSTKWLDIKSMCESFLHIIGNQAMIQRIYYFSALATHLQKDHPEKIKKHKIFIEALESRGISVQLGRFKPKEVWCSNCRKMINKHEEKETDVAISAKIFEILIKDEAETIIIISGDTDLAPVIRTAKYLYPAKQIIFGFPYKRENRELKKLVLKSFSISKETYHKYQFPQQLIVGNKILIKPNSW